MRKLSMLTAIGLVIFFLLCLVPAGNAQQPECVPVSDPGAPNWQMGLKCTFNSTSTPFTFTASSLTYWQLFFVPSGTVTTATVSLDSSATGASFSTGGILAAATIGSVASAGSYSNTSATTPTNFGQITPTVTGSGSVTVVLFGYRNSSGGASGTVTVSNFPNPQTVNGTVNTQPSGFGSIVGFQQAVTASAVVLATNAVHGFCVKAFTSNSITIYVGPSGVTTATGYPLAAGDSICYQASNTNLAYVVAASTGASVAVSGT